MNNKRMYSILLITMILAFTGCSSNKMTDEDKKVAYNSAKVAEDKVNTLFHKSTTEDGTPILDPATGSVEQAKELLHGYYSNEMTNKIIDHYVTKERVGDAIVVKTDPFFTSSLLSTTMDDVKMDGDKKKLNLKTADNATYVTTWDKDKDTYIITGYEK